MVTLMQLWAPIVLSAVRVFVASSVIHMVLQFHKPEYKGFANEDEVRAAMARQPLPPGKYVVPYCDDHKRMGEPEMLRKFQEGPVGIMLVRPPGLMNMGKLLGSWFLFALVVAFVVAYVASHTLPAGTSYLEVFRVVGAITFLAYTAGSVIDGIWMGKQWSAVLRDAIDGLVYACVSGGAFGWLWPR